ncbi:MAG: electron transfer flavoprotein subunit beta/FixA family protein [Candidatus Stahlbacteria bacterium]|nr:electron transfer flavoprotein subunit beta/FixA family protein [Candidatus Stahlbacteria bacterium]
MKIIVCIKQVPDIAREVEGTIDLLNIASIINPLDMYAIEEALRIRQKFGGEIIVISMGPIQAKNGIREAISMGADKGILISDTNFNDADTLATARTIAAAIKRIGKFDLILCGKQAIDGETAQVPPQIAELLDIPVVTFVRRIEEINNKYAKVERIIEVGIEEVKVFLPTLLTVVKEINEPRLPTLKGILRAKQTEIPVWGLALLNLSADEVGIKGSATQVIRTATVKQKREGNIFHSATDESIELITSICNNSS